MTRKRTSETDLAVSGSGATVPVRRKSASRPRAKRALEAQETPASPAVEQNTVAPEAIAAPIPAPAPNPAVTPSHEEIAKLAYLYWEARGCQDGCQEEDWLRAEEELRNRATSVAAV